MENARFVPIFLNVGDSPVVIVGGGKAALAKLKGLLPFQPVVKLIAPAIAEETEIWIRKFLRIETFRRPWAPEDLNEAALAYVFTDDDAVNTEVEEEARRRRIPVNVARRSGRTGFLSPASAQIKGWTLAVSSGGQSPSAARKARDFLAGVLDSWLDDETKTEKV